MGVHLNDAGIEVWGKRMQGTTRYTLSGLAFLVCLALPVAAFIPGETLATALLKKLDAPVAVSVIPSSATRASRVRRSASPIAR